MPEGAGVPEGAGLEDAGLDAAEARSEPTVTTTWAVQAAACGQATA